MLYEIEQTVNAERKERLLFLVQEANENLEINQKTLEHAEKLSALGFGEYDALHLSAAESSNVDVFLTTDDQLQKLADKNKKRLSLSVINPVKWLEDTLNMKTDTLSLYEIRTIGFEALIRELGPGLIRFIQQYEAGQGDYTRDRKKILPKKSVREIGREIIKAGKQKNNNQNALVVGHNLSKEWSLERGEKEW